MSERVTLHHKDMTYWVECDVQPIAAGESSHELIQVNSITFMREQARVEGIDPNSDWGKRISEMLGIASVLGLVTKYMSLDESDDRIHYLWAAWYDEVIASGEDPDFC